jgi:hypothetical protein
MAKMFNFLSLLNVTTPDEQKPLRLFVRKYCVGENHFYYLHAHTQLIQPPTLSLFVTLLFSVSAQADLCVRSTLFCRGFDAHFAL